MSIAFIPDLKASRDLKCSITLMTPYQEYKYVSVRDLNEDDEFIVIHTPKRFGDKITTTTILLSDLASVQLHPDMAA